MWDVPKEKNNGSVRVLYTQEGQRGLGIIPISSHDRNRGSYKGMNGSGKEKSCRGEGYLLLLLLFAENKSERDGYQLSGIWIGKLLCYGGN